jgi:hypothetical protein
MDSDNWAAVRRRVVVQKICGFLSSTRVVRASRLVVGIPICSQRLDFTPFLVHVPFGLTKLMGLIGAVSVGVWQMACKRVISIGERAVKDLAGAFRGSFGTAASFNPCFIYIRIPFRGIGIGTSELSEE